MTMELTDILSTLDTLETPLERINFIENAVTFSHFYSYYKHVVNSINSFKKYQFDTRYNIYEEVLEIIEGYVQLGEDEINIEVDNIEFSHQVLNEFSPVDIECYSKNNSYTFLPVKSKAQRTKFLEKTLLKSYELDILRTYVQSSIEHHQIRV